MTGSQDEVAPLPCSKFGPFDGRIWLDAAHQGPLPTSAIEAAHEALALKRSPARLQDDMFFVLPERLRASLGRLLGVLPDEVVLANSASYGLHLLANGLPWSDGDDVLLVGGDFPATILPWLALRRRGVTVRLLPATRGSAPSPAAIADALHARTRLFCVSWVNSFSGQGVDLDELGRLCHANGTIFVVNGTQAVGAQDLRLRATPVDALVSSGFKWLCGPYGTGLLWLRPELLDLLEYNQAYWLAYQQGGRLSLGAEAAELAAPVRSVRTYDVFGTANFLNFGPWTPAIELLETVGVARISEHNQGLVSRLIDGLDRSLYDVLSPEQTGHARSTLVVLSHRDAERNPTIHRSLARAGIDVALRNGNLRVAPHLYNSESDIQAALDALSDAA